VPYTPGRHPVEPDFVWRLDIVPYDRQLDRNSSKL
jgi:hypothetical protein